MGRLKLKSTREDTNGFTIVELMVALSVLSTILVMGTVVMMQIGRLYSKGVNAANTQNTTRNVITDLSSALQFSGNAPTTCPAATTALVCAAASRDYSGSGSGEKIYAICVNNARYSFVLNRKQGTDYDDKRTHHVLWRDLMKNSSTCQPLNIAQETVVADEASAEGPGGDSQGFDMLSEHMRLTKFRLVETASDSGIFKIEVWIAFGDSDLVKSDGTGCNSGIGSQFCATSLQSVTVTRRI